MEKIQLIDNDSDNEYFETNRVCARIMLEEETENSVERQRQSCTYVRRNHVGAGNRLMQDYFVEQSTYPASYFRRRFRMRRELFMQNVEGISSYSANNIPDYFKYFEQRGDCRGVFGSTTIQKCTAVIRQLVYGSTADSLDEYLQMAEKITLLCLDNLCKCSFHLYSDQYLRKPTHDDIEKLYKKHEEIHGFPGMLGSIDCMHWAWHKCLNAWKGQYTRGDHGYPSLILEAVASYDLWIWHAFFGVTGSNNDINVLKQSSLFEDIINDTAANASF